MFKQIHKLNRGTNFHLYKSCDSVGICWLLVMGLLSVHLTPEVRPFCWITLGTGLPDFSHAPEEHRWEGCTCACFSLGTWGQLASPPSQLLCRAGGWEWHSAPAPTPICLGNRQFLLPPASSFRHSLCQPMTALWDQIEQSPELGVQKPVLPWSLPPGTYVLLGGSCVCVCPASSPLKDVVAIQMGRRLTLWSAMLLWISEAMLVCEVSFPNWGPELGR